MVLYATIEKDAIDLHSPTWKDAYATCSMKKRVGGRFKIACIVATYCFQNLKKNAFVKAWIACNNHPAQDKPN